MMLFRNYEGFQEVVNMAKNNPDINFIGIEKYDSVMVKAVEKLESELSILINDLFK